MFVELEEEARTVPLVVRLGPELQVFVKVKSDDLVFVADFRVSVQVGSYGEGD
jgi:hypothetical protein